MSDVLAEIEKQALAQVVAERTARVIERRYLEELIDLRAKFAVRLRSVSEERDRLVLEAVDALKAARAGLPNPTPFQMADEDEAGPARRRNARVAALAAADKSFIAARDRAADRYSTAAAKFRGELEAAEAKLGAHFAELSARAARGAA
jgi:hypothetical protein